MKRRIIFNIKSNLYNFNYKVKNILLLNYNNNCYSFVTDNKNTFECYYKILNLNVSATQDEIKYEYLKLAKKYHPDNNPNLISKDTEHFKKVTEAYSILSNEDKRRAYDSKILGKNQYVNYNQYNTNKFKNFDTFKKYNDCIKTTDINNMNSNIDKNEYQRNNKIQELKEKLKKGNSLESLAPKFNSFIKYEEYNLNPSQKAWNKLKYDYTQMYNPHDKFHLEKNFKDEYNLHNDEETVGDNQYFESKKDDEFYSKSRLERVKIIAKEKLNAINKCIKK